MHIGYMMVANHDILRIEVFEIEAEVWLFTGGSSIT